ncbi:LegC family aminotransferase [Candidatus Epulonipiscium viviparus]|uniref:LegC family aminotransferase n=1 Tax=Candidatus Epulonipiscium viviparus TaxID=420336 RepID=UPI00016C047B|nr:LegC family aminotransferase [Candidatus Epulopiscium viviparus]
MIPLSVPNLKGNELKYVTKALEAEWVSTGGAYINQFEKDLAEYICAPAAVAVASGTAGLHLALLEAGVTAGDYVIAPTLTFIAAVNPIKYVGAAPLFMDCDDSLCLDVAKVEKFVATECVFANNVLTFRDKPIKAIMVVHVFGNLANMMALMAIARKYNLKVIEDATEALGTYAIVDGHKKFAGTIGDFGVFSFNGNKIITTGGGGMVVALDADKLKHIKYLSTQAKDDELNYIHNEIGYNYRMTNVQAAIGVGQLEQLEKFVAIKKNNYELYKELLKSVTEVELINFRTDIRPNYWFYSVQFAEGIDIGKFIQSLLHKGIGSRPIWGLIHKQAPYQSDYAFEIERADKYVTSIINIPCSSNLKSEEIQNVVTAIKEILANG